MTNQIHLSKNREKHELCPLEFTPLLKRIRWGGRRLGTLLNKPLGDASDYAESWEIADHGDDQSRVADGPLAGQSLHELVVHRGTELLGQHTGLGQFPLLCKFLDANDKLSVQVHPNDDQARRWNPNENGKTEAWLIVHAEPGSLVWAGLKKGVGRVQIENALRDGTLEECLHSFSVSAGDCVFVPAGTVHAIGAGILLAEVQQSSDVTFRLYDWGRVDAQGHPRELHIEQALQCIDFERGPVGLVQPRIVRDGPNSVEELVKCPYFELRRHTVRGEQHLPIENRFVVLMVLCGTGTLERTRPLAAGSTVLLPASLPNASIQSENELVILTATLPYENQRLDISGFSP